jgi:hypothetical protein
LIQGLRLFILHPTGAALHLPYDHVTGDKWIMCLYIRVAASIVPFILFLQKITRNPHNYPIIFEYVRDSTTTWYIHHCFRTCSYVVLFLQRNKCSLFKELRNGFLYMNLQAQKSRSTLSAWVVARHFHLPSKFLFNSIWPYTKQFKPSIQSPE